MFVLAGFFFIALWFLGAFYVHAAGSYVHFFLLFGLLSLVAQSARGSRGRGQKGRAFHTLVLRKFVLGEPGAPIRLEILGRQVGLQAFLLTLLRIDPESHLVLTAESLNVTTTSLWGTSRIHVPLKKIQGTECGYERSIGALVVAAVSILLAVLMLISMLFMNTSLAQVSTPAVVVLLLMGGIAAAIYIMSKTIVIRSSAGLVELGYAFKRSLLENMAIDLPQAMAAVDVLNASILQAQAGLALAQIATVKCPHCGAGNPAGTAFCESCGKAT